MRVPLSRPLAAAVAMAATIPAAAGCADQPGSIIPIQIAASYVPVPRVPGATVAYALIRDNAGADRLVSATTSDGGQVSFVTPVSPGATATRVVQWVPVPAHGDLTMEPDTVHMVITGIGRLVGGDTITLTLRFARAGKVSTQTVVTNPATGGSSYFLN